jgi:molybdopterin-binding protein
MHIVRCDVVDSPQLNRFYVASQALGELEAAVVFEPVRRSRLKDSETMSRWSVPSGIQGSEGSTMRNMKISARNQLRGIVEVIDLGVVTAKVGVRVGDNLIESVITRQSVVDLNIKIGSEVTAVIKSTEIMLMVD